MNRGRENPTDSTERRRRWGAHAATALVTAVATAAGVWAITTLTAPAEDPTSAEAHAFATVREGEVGASMTLNAIASWTPTVVGANQASGIVTSVQHAPGAVAAPGDELFSVDLRPVVVAQGDVPAFRALGRDLEGADVEQLRALLVTLGHYDGAVDGVARGATDRAIRAWQEDLGVPVTGTVKLGDIVFVPALPARISLDHELITRGAILDGGEPVVLALADAPEVIVPATDRQSAMMPTDTTVSITGPNGEQWVAHAGGRERDPETDHLDIRLTGIDGHALCGDDCAVIPVDGETPLDAVITTAETVSGLVIPAAALITDANGTQSVIDATGRRRAVTVVASANGMSVIEGVRAGTRVQVPGPAKDPTQ